MPRRVDPVVGSQLTLTDGTKITGGDLTIDGSGTVNIESGSNSSVVTLDNVSLTNNGAIDIGETTSGALLTLDGYVTVNLGTVNDTGDNSALYAEGTETLDNGTLYIGSTGGGHLVNYDPTGVGTTLTLGPDLTINQTGMAQISSTNASGDSVVSYATINASAADFFYIQPNDFTNYGQINGDASGGTLDIIPTDWFTNYGTVAVSNGEDATIGNGFVSDIQPGGATNEASGVISVSGVGSSVSIAASSFTNNGLLEATNGGTIDVRDGTVDNTGTGADGIALGGTSTLLVDTATLDLTGGGDVSLANGSQIIENAHSPLLTVNGGSLPALDLDNIDNIISGAGTIGNSGDGLLALTNGGTIDANVSGEALTINTGNAVTNTGTLEASNGGTLLIDDAVNNSGAGNALIEGGIVDFASTTNVNEITFNNGSGTPAYGELVLGDPTNGYSATINGFTGTAPGLSTSDGINLAGTWTVESETSSGGNTVLALKDGTATVTLTFDDFSGTLNIASDGHGGTLITDPPPTNSPSPSVSIGGAGNDSFHFHPGLGGDTGSFNPPADTTEFGHFSSPEDQYWATSLIKEDVVECVHVGDANTPPELDATHWHALHNAVYLH